MADELERIVHRHTTQIESLEDGYGRHSAFLFGRFDEKTNVWQPGFAERLSDAVVDIGEIRLSIGTFTKWAQTSLARVMVAAVCFAFSALGAAVWFIATHFDKIAKAFQ